MNLYRISQSVNDDWDTYDSAVVVAENAEEAKKIIPHFTNSDISTLSNSQFLDLIYRDGINVEEWAKPEDVKAEFIGNANKDFLDSLNGRTTVVASFNAG
ncbi:hypothetical protein EFA59_02645 [Weissella hellenica]|nr:hypothetical protein EFA59_02645 [Weissella hellenica]